MAGLTAFIIITLFLVHGLAQDNPIEPADSTVANVATDAGSIISTGQVEGGTPTIVKTTTTTTITTTKKTTVPATTTVAIATTTVAIATTTAKAPKVVTEAVAAVPAVEQQAAAGSISRISYLIQFAEFLVASYIMIGF